MAVLNGKPDALSEKVSRNKKQLGIFSQCFLTFEKYHGILIMTPDCCF